MSTGTYKLTFKKINAVHYITLPFITENIIKVIKKEVGKGDRRDFIVKLAGAHLHLKVQTIKE